MISRCLRCVRRIDLHELLAAKHGGLEYRCPCGRVLVESTPNDSAAGVEADGASSRSQENDRV